MLACDHAMTLIVSDPILIRIASFEILQAAGVTNMDRLLQKLLDDVANWIMPNWSIILLIATCPDANLLGNTVGQLRTKHTCKNIAK